MPEALHGAGALGEARAAIAWRASECSPAPHRSTPRNAGRTFLERVPEAARTLSLAPGLARRVGPRRLRSRGYRPGGTRCRWRSGLMDGAGGRCYACDRVTSSLASHAPGANAAVVTCALMIAQQVAGKAARDALFLSSFHASSLPRVMASRGGALRSRASSGCRGS